MALAKLMIFIDGQLTPVVALFNPTEYSIEQSARWVDLPTVTGDSPKQQHTGRNRATLRLDLFFDTYESGVDVRLYTQRIARLAAVDTVSGSGQPPACKLVWGLGGVFFRGRLQSVNQRYTLFLPSGTPVRATLGCTFLEWETDWDQALGSLTEHLSISSSRALQVGETLSSIASSEYRDPTLWRPIAEENGIDDPRSIGPGSTLSIPSRRR